MPWAHIESDLFRHEKVAAIEPRARPLAVALFVGMICHCSEMLSNGRLDVAIAYSIGRYLGVSRPRKALQELERVHLIERSSDEIVLPDFLDFHKSREEVLEDRKRAAERKRRSRGQQSLDFVTEGQESAVTSSSRRDIARDSRAHERGRRDRYRDTSLATEARDPAPAEPAADLPFHLELLITEAQAENASAETIRKAAAGLPEAAVARAREALRTRRPFPDVPAAYVVGVLQRLRESSERPPEPEL